MEWLPFWGNVNENKSLFLKQLINKFKILRNNNISFILYQKNIPNDIIKLILNF